MKNQFDEANPSAIPSDESQAASELSADPSPLRKAEMEESLEKFALGGLANLFKAITGYECEKYLALGMATSAVSSLIMERDAFREALKQIRDHPHNSYDNTNSVDVTDGHRCAAAIARAVLEDTQDTKSGVSPALSAGAVASSVQHESKSSSTPSSESSRVIAERYFALISKDSSADVVGILEQLVNLVRLESSSSTPRDTWNEAIRVAQDSVTKSQAAKLDTAAAEILIRRLEAARDRIASPDEVVAEETEGSQ